VSGFTFGPRPQCGGARRPTRSGTVGLGQTSKWLGWPTAERPTSHGAGERALPRGHRARRGVVAHCPPAARLPRWKMSAGVITDVERWTCRARRQGHGLPEEVARRWGGGENSARRRGKPRRWSALPRGTPAALQE
jgi:hypothetical protein